MAAPRARLSFDRIRHSKGGAKPGEVRPRNAGVMQSGFSVFRRGDTLNDGLDKLIALRGSLENVTVDNNSLLGMSVSSQRWNSPISQTGRSDRAFGMRSPRRRAHAREDFKERDDRIG